MYCVPWMFVDHCVHPLPLHLDGTHPLIICISIFVSGGEMLLLSACLCGDSPAEGVSRWQIGSVPAIKSYQ